MTRNCTASLIALIAAVAHARPADSPDDLRPFLDRHDHCVKYNNDPTTEKTYDDDPWMAAVKTMGGGTLQISESFSTTCSWTVGFDLGLDDGGPIKAGLSVSVSTSTTTQISETAGLECPDGPWMCGVLVYPTLFEVSGTAESKKCAFTESGDAQPGPYTIRYPKVDQAGNQGFRPEVCVCKNREHWEDPGAPTLVCTEDC